MPFNFNAPSFFGKLGPQSAGFNPNNAVAGFQRANAISGAVPNLFTTIQMTQKNQQDRRVKEAAIAQALAGLVKTQQEVQQSPYELAIKQQLAAAEMELNPAKKALAEAQANAYKTTAQYQADKVAIDKAKNERLLKQQVMLDKLLNGGQSDGTDGVVGALGGNLPPGTTINVGGIRVPLNQRLTDAEQAAVAGNVAIEPVVDRILTSVDTIFTEPKTTKDKISRTVRQGIADSDNTLLSSQDPELQSFQQELANLRRLIPFTDGGKQLTPFEAKRVFSLLNTTGKNNPQIKKDISAAVSIVKAKGGLSLGGRQAAVNMAESAKNKPNNSNLQALQAELDKTNQELAALGGE